MPLILLRHSVRQWWSSDENQACCESLRSLARYKCQFPVWWTQELGRIFAILPEITHIWDYSQKRRSPCLFLKKKESKHLIKWETRRLSVDQTHPMKSRISYSVYPWCWYQWKKVPSFSSQRPCLPCSPCSSEYWRISSKSRDFWGSLQTRAQTRSRMSLPGTL